MEPSAATTIDHRWPQGSAQDSLSGRDHTPESPSPSPIISDATIKEFVTTPSSAVRPPATVLSTFLLPHQYLCFIFPVTLAFGSMFGTFNENQPTYFTNKRNILNVLFVKNGWGWTSLVFLVYVAVVFGKAMILQKSNVQRESRSSESSSQSMVGTNPPAQGTPASANLSKTVIIKALTRWVFATMYWWVISQSFFGPAVFDRFFVLTGGKCSVDGHYSIYDCRRTGGTWAGGVDISGHMFLLTHAWLFLMEELSVFLNDPKAWTALQRRPLAKYVVFAVGGLCFLWWWMILITSAYFHHLTEKVFGLIFGMLFWVLTYVTTYKWASFMPDQAAIL